MLMRQRLLSTGVMASIMLVTTPLDTFAQQTAYPTKTVLLVVPFPAG
jgi:tripartite-type tricarboxylate transporter receptor subunit TctC